MRASLAILVPVIFFSKSRWRLGVWFLEIQHQVTFSENSAQESKIKRQKVSCPSPPHPLCMDLYTEREVK